MFPAFQLSAKLDADDEGFFSKHMEDNAAEISARP